MKKLSKEDKDCIFAIVCTVLLASGIMLLAIAHM